MADQPKAALPVESPTEAATVEHLDSKLVTFVNQLHEALAAPPFAEEAGANQIEPILRATLDPSGHSTEQAETVAPMPNPDPEVTAAQTVERPMKEKLPLLSPPQKADEIGRIAGYRVLRKLGEGGMGMVFEAEDIKLERRVALKVMKPEVASVGAHAARFVNEARIAARVEHDHICPIYQVGEANDVPFIAMPFLKGEPLDAKIRREKPLEVNEALRIGREIAEGLHMAHQHGLIHRDIKPANIWLEALPNRHPRVRILDFGLARLETDTEHLTQTGAVMGTPAYMSPEQGRGKPLDNRSDLFSLGVILYEMTTGKRPFTGADTMSILTSLAIDEPAPADQVNPRIPRDLAKLISRLLSKSPDRRPANGQQVANELLAIQTSATMPVVELIQPRVEVSTPSLGDPWENLDDTVEPPKPKPKPKVKKEPTKRSPMVALLLAGLFLLVGGFTTYKLIFESKDGTLVVEVEQEADLRFKNGSLEINDENGKLKYTLSPSEKNKTLPPGSYLVKVVGADGVKLETDHFEMSKNGKVVLKVKATGTETAKGKQTIPAERDFGLALRPSDRIAIPSLKLSVAEGFTLEGYVTPGSLTGGQNLPIFLYNVANLNGPKFWRIDVYCEKGVRIKESAVAVVPGRRTHVAAVFGKTEFVLYVDGVEAARGNYQGDSAPTAKQELEFGFEYNGQIDEVRVSKGSRYEKPFTPQKRFETDDRTLALYHFDEGEGNEFKDSSGNKHHGKVGSARWVKAGESGTSFEADRKAAEYVLGMGGKVIIDESGSWIAAVADLPRQPFRLTRVLLPSNPNVTDDGLKVFDDCREVVHLEIGAEISAAGVGHFKNCTKLKQIYLHSHQLDDSTLIPFENCPLESLGIVSNRMTDAGLAKLRDPRNLVLLRIWGIKITDAGLAHFKECSKLTSLELGSTQISDAGLARFARLSGLTHLQLLDCDGLTDAGLIPFRECRELKLAAIRGKRFSAAALDPFVTSPKIEQLDLSGPSVNDEWLTRLNNWKSLTRLRLNDTAVTDEGVQALAHVRNLSNFEIALGKLTEAGLKKLAAALPFCKIQWDGGVIEPRPSPDRKAAEYVLSVGGQVGIDDEPYKMILAAADLPKRPFRLTNVQLGRNNPLVNDDGLAVFDDCRHLLMLNVPENTAVTDAGMKHFRNCAKIRVLNLSTRSLGGAALTPFRDCPIQDIAIGSDVITDADLEQIPNRKELEGLTLHGTRITDDGVARFKESRKLSLLSLACPHLTNAGVAVFRGLADLTQLQLKSDEMTDEAFASFEDCGKLSSLDITGKRLTEASLGRMKACSKLGLLHLRGPSVGDAWLSHLKNHPALEMIELHETSVTDRGLEALAGVKTLTRVFLNGSSVTEVAAKKLAAAQPKCKVEWNGKVVEPPVSPDRKAAEYVLSVGGWVGLDGANDPSFMLKKASELPKGPFRLTALSLAHSQLTTDDGLAIFESCRDVTSLTLFSTPVSEAGLMHFKNCTGLKHLVVAPITLSDAGLAPFADCPLVTLAITGNAVTDAGLTRMKRIQNLETLCLNSPKITDKGVAHFKDCKKLKEIGLYHFNLTDKGLAGFTGMTALRTLAILSDGLTDAGLTPFQECERLIFLTLDGNRLTDAALLPFKKCTHLNSVIFYAAAGDRWLTHLKDWPELEHVALERTAVTDEGLLALAEVKTLKQIRIIEGKVTEAAAKKLAAAMPKCRVEWNGKVASMLPNDADKPFVLMRDGKPAGEFKGFAGALAERKAGDVIEVHGNGPFALSPVRVDQRGLHLKAAAGFRPLFFGSAANDYLVSVDQGGSLHLEGCDIEVTPTLNVFGCLNGVGDWTIRDCRLSVPAGQNPGVMSFGGNRLTVENSVLLGDSSHYTISLVGNEAVFTNCLIRGGAYTLFAFGVDKPTSLRLDRCSLSGTYVAFSIPAEATSLIDLSVTACVLETGSLVQYADNRAIDAKKVRWRGEGNLYAVRDHLLFSYGKYVVKTLDEWGKFWDGKDANPRLVAGPLFGHEAWSLPTERVAATLATWKRPAESKAGPDFALLGPGDGYVKSLAASGKPVAKENLRPEPPETGAFCLIRDGKLLRGYPNLPEAVEAARDGDVVELRADRLEAGLNRSELKEGKRLTLRAAPGYRGELRQPLWLSPEDDWTLEGLHLREYHLYRGRLVNCFGDITPGRHQLTWGRPGTHVELKRCLFPALELKALQDGTLTIEDSAIGKLGVDGAKERKLSVKAERSLLGNNGVYTFVNYTRATLDLEANSSILVPRLFEVGQEARTTWAGRGNVYLSRPGAGPWRHTSKGWDVFDLGSLRAAYGSDADSVEGLLPIADPEQWRLPMEYEGKFGADVDKLSGGMIDRHVMAEPRKESATPPNRKVELIGGFGASPRDAEKPFALIRDGKEAGAFKTFAGVWGDLQPSDEIEVRGNGPFTLPSIQVPERGFRMKAAAGFRPRFQVADQGIVFNNVPEAFLKLEGCDFDCEGTLVFGVGSWEIRDCRISQRDSRDRYLLGFSGRKLAVVDSIFYSGYSNQPMVHLNDAAQAEFSNCLIGSNFSAIFRFEVEKPLSLRLDRCTFGTRPGGVFYLGLKAKPLLDVKATNCVFEVGQFLFGSGHKWADKPFKWVGEGNLYSIVAPEIVSGFSDMPSKKPAEWQALWDGKEVNPRFATGSLFGITSLPLSAERTVELLSSWKLPKDIKAGPDLSLVGPGEPYLKSLAAQGKPVPKEQLRPEPHDNGPVVLLREDKVVSGYFDLGSAISAAKDGDTVEIRADKLSTVPFRPNAKDAKKLRIRAAPGYRGVVEKAFNQIPNDEWTVENLEFRGQTQLQNVKLVNCCKVETEDPILLRGELGASRFEIFGCLFRKLDVHAKDQAAVRVVGSAVRQMQVYRLARPEEPDPKIQIEVERSLLGQPQNGSFLVTDQIDHRIKVESSVVVPQIVFGKNSALVWSGDRNVYLNRPGIRAWIQPFDEKNPPIFNLADWRKKWNSDTGSVEAASPVYDLDQWRLPKEYEGKVGADLEKVAKPR